MGTILCGLPAFSEELGEDLAAGRIVLGGCLVSDEDPTWMCTDCSVRIYRGNPDHPTSP